MFLRLKTPVPCLETLLLFTEKTAKHVFNVFRDRKVQRDGTVNTRRAHAPVDARRCGCSSMAATDDESRPLIREAPTVVVQGYSSHAAKKKQPAHASDLKISLKGVVGIFFAAIILFALAAITSRTIQWGDSSASSDAGTEDSNTSRLAADLAEVEPTAAAAVVSGHGLVKPFNGTHPTLTSTE